MGGLKKPLSQKGYYFIQVLKQCIGWLNIPYILASWRLAIFS